MRGVADLLVTAAAAAAAFAISSLFFCVFFVGLLAVSDLLTSSFPSSEVSATARYVCVHIYRSQLTISTSRTG